MRPIGRIRRWRGHVGVLVVCLPLVLGAGGAGAQSAEYAPTVDPADFSTTIDNPLFPLDPGTRWVYEGPGDGGETEHQEVVVTSETKDVMGVTCRVVHDVVRVDGRLVEDTYDWYAQHKDGSVWYFGEDTREVQFGVVTSRSGSWEAGKDGAQPGIIMLADPQVGDRYRNEYYKGEAEDQAEVMSRSENVTVPAGTYNGVLQTRDWTDLEPGVLEHKYYARGIGIIKEVQVQGGSGYLELIEMTRGGTSASEPFPVPLPELPAPGTQP